MDKNTSIFTDSGKSLILEAAGSKAKITYTKAVLAYDHAQDHTGDYYKKLTKLDDIRKEVPISINVIDNNTIKLGASFSNKDVHESIFYNVVGWYAKSESQDNILVAVTTLGALDNGVLNPTDASDGGATIALDYYFDFVVDDAKNVVINASDAGTVTHPELNLALATKADSKDVNIYNKEIINNPSIDDLNGLSRSFQYVTYLRPHDALGAGSSSPINALVITLGGGESIGLQLIIGEDGQLFGRSKKNDIWFPFSAVNAGLNQGIKVLFEESLNRENSIAELIKKISTNQSEIDQINNSKIPSLTEYYRVILEELPNLVSNKAFDGIVSEIDKELLKKADNATVSTNTQLIKDNQGSIKGLNDKLESFKNKEFNSLNISFNNLNSSAVKKVNNTTPDKNGNINVHSQIVRGYDIATKQSTSKKDENIGGSWLIDQQALGGIADAINKINGNTKLTNATDINTLTSTGLYILQNLGNTNTPSFFSDKRGDLIVLNFDGNAKTQVWFPVGVSGRESNFAIRYWEGNNYGTWHKIINDSDLDNVKNHTVSVGDVLSNPSEGKILGLSPGVQQVHQYNTDIDAGNGGVEDITLSGVIITTPAEQPISSNPDDRYANQFFITAESLVCWRYITQNGAPNWTATSITDLLSVSNQVGKIKNTLLPSLKSEITDKLAGYVGYSKSVTNPEDSAVKNYPQGIQTIYNFTPKGLTGSISGQLITLYNPLSTWSWKEQIFIGVQGQFGYRLIDGSSVGDWNFIKDGSNIANRGLDQMFSRLNEYPSLKSRVEALERKVK